MNNENYLKSIDDACIDYANFIKKSVSEHPFINIVHKIEVGEWMDEAVTSLGGARTTVKDKMGGFSDAISKYSTKFKHLTGMGFSKESIKESDVNKHKFTGLMD